MTKHWRPENWEEIKAKSIKALIANKDKAYPPIYTQGEIFEAGADALLQYFLDSGIINLEMLEALGAKHDRDRQAKIK